MSETGSEEYQEFNELMFHVRGFWIFTIVFICIDFLFLPCRLTGHYYNPTKDFEVFWHNVFFALYIPAWFTSVILETYVFAAISDYYSKNHYEPLEGLQAYRSCSSSVFDSALDILQESSFIPERPAGQYVCLILSWLELFLQFFYLNVQRHAYADQMREQQIEAEKEQETQKKIHDEELAAEEQKKAMESEF